MPSTGVQKQLIDIPGDQASFVDGVAFDPSGRYLLLSTRAPAIDLTIVDVVNATVVRQVAMADEPDGISFHWTDPQFVVTNNTDGTMTRFDFAGGDLLSPPSVSTFASGGFRGDLSLVGADGCAYVTQNGTRFADGTTQGTNSIVRICPGFTPSTGVKPATSPVLFVHGVSESADDNVFTSLFARVKNSAPGVSISSFEFYQDKAGSDGAGGCRTADPGQQKVVLPSNMYGMPYDGSQNSQTFCDSVGDIGQSAIRLENEIRRLYQSSGKKVILVGYSMGGETIRTFLAYSMTANDEVAATMVDSVVTMHGVQQGSWVAAAAPYLQSHKLDWVLNKIPAPDPKRPATKQFDPNAAFLKWVHANSGNLPQVPYYNTWGDERIQPVHCFLVWCYHGPDESIGDVVLMPGTDRPTQDQSDGGERFAPRGYTSQSWQWNELKRIEWFPDLDQFQITALTEAIKAPQQHSNITGRQSEISVVDCQTGQSVSVDDELARVISARATGTTYAGNTSSPHL